MMLLMVVLVIDRIVGCSGGVECVLINLVNVISW